MTATTPHQKTLRDGRTVYYATAYGEYRELKDFHRHLLNAWVDHKKWARWQNKTVYRSGPEPRHFPGLSSMVPDYAGCQRHVPRFGESGYRAEKKYGYRFNNLYLHVLTQYRNARHPQPSPDLVPTLELPSNWRELANELRQFYTN